MTGIGDRPTRNRKYVQKTNYSLRNPERNANVFSRIFWIRVNEGAERKAITRIRESWNDVSGGAWWRVVALRAPHFYALSGGGFHGIVSTGEIDGRLARVHE